MHRPWKNQQSSTSSYILQHLLVKLQNFYLKKSKLIIQFYLLANICTFAIGASFVWPSPMIPKLNGAIDLKHNPLKSPINSFEESWIASLSPLGSIVGPLIFGILADFLGRKISLIICILPVITGYIICAFAEDVGLFYAARFINGIGASGLYTVMPMFIGEIAENSNRGALGCFITIFAALGNLFTYTIGPFMTVKVFNLISLIIPTIFLITFMLIVPESPYYYLTKGKNEKAKESLRSYRNGNSNKIDDELQIMKKTIEESQGNDEKFFDIIKISGQRKALIITLFLSILQELTGIDIILNYLQSIFATVDGLISAENSSIIVGAVQAVVCIITSLLIDKIGRRLLTLISFLGCVLSMTSLGIFFRMKDDGYDMTAVGYLPILSLIFFIIAYNIGIGTIPYTLISELFPQNVKSRAATLAIFANLFFSFVTTNIFHYMIDSFGMGESFWIFAACSLIGFIYVFLYVPETKGKSFMDIQLILNS